MPRALLQNRYRCGRMMRVELDGYSAENVGVVLRQAKHCPDHGQGCPIALDSSDPPGPSSVPGPSGPDA